jgi:hypothetical protein
MFLFFSRYPFYILFHFFYYFCPMVTIKNPSPKQHSLSCFVQIQIMLHLQQFRNTPSFHHPNPKATDFSASDKQTLISKLKTIKAICTYSHRGGQIFNAQTAKLHRKHAIFSKADFTPKTCNQSQKKGAKNSSKRHKQHQITTHNFASNNLSKTISRTE